jgi:hypothetical protein
MNLRRVIPFLLFLASLWFNLVQVPTGNAFSYVGPEGTGDRLPTPWQTTRISGQLIEQQKSQEGAMLMLSALLWADGLGGALESAGVRLFSREVAGGTSLLPARSPWPANSGFIEGTVERKFLMPGETFDRYGFGGGKFVSPVGTPIEARALRPGTESLPFNTYQVVKPFEVNAGGVQPWFGQPGLGTQYELPVSVNTLLNRGIIKPAP